MWRPHIVSPTTASALLLIFAVLWLPGCHDSSDGGVMDLPGPFALTFSLDDSFQRIHGGQPIHWALVRSADGLVVAAGGGTVSATTNPSFSLSTGAVMEKEVPYEIHYWIDSNFGGGTAGVCDPRAIDHQWSTEFLSPTNDIRFTVSHNAALTEDVCATFGP